MLYNKYYYGKLPQTGRDTPGGFRDTEALSAGRVPGQK